MDEAHLIVKGYYVPLLKRYIENNLPAEDFLWRPWWSFHPMGAPGNIGIALEYDNYSDPGRFVVDDYQVNTALTQSSSGANVSYTVGAVFEGQTRDQDCTFDWEVDPNSNRCPLNCEADIQLNQPFNGMTRAQLDENHRAVVFEWPVSVPGPTSYSYSLDVLPGQKDLRSKRFFTFRAAQMPRHPSTLAEGSDVDLSVTIKDGQGRTATIPTSALGSGIIEPYGRRDDALHFLRLCTYSGAPCVTVDNDGTCCVQAVTPEDCDVVQSDPGWQAEYETVRMRLLDFKNVAPELDLSDVTQVTFLFGPLAGSSVGRLALDDIAFTSK
jgi:hypothetical protein